MHVPFCEKLCWYCGCATTVPNGYRRVESYVEILHREIDLWASRLPDHAGLRHLHFGGGSPNSLSCGDFRGIVTHLRDAFGARGDLEIDIELDPRTTTDAFIETLAAFGVKGRSERWPTLWISVER